jgi:predicted dehydrogenase
MEVLAKSGAAVVSAICDPTEKMVRAALEAAPGATIAATMEELFDGDLDGVVIATPSALHAEQTLAALERNLSVFCQKPLGRNAAEVKEVVDAARARGRLLGVDLSYRRTEALMKVKELIASGALGHVHALDLVFHNAYGPDKPWFYERALSGGGCLIDLGLHLVDAALWLLDAAGVEWASGRLFRQGRPFSPEEDGVEDHAIAELAMTGDRVARIACSWKLHAGQDAVIRIDAYGTEGGACMRNVGGSFYDFVAEHWVGTSTNVLASPPDAWGGRALIAWAEQLARGESLSLLEARSFVQSAEVLDALYLSGTSPAPRKERGEAQNGKRIEGDDQSRYDSRVGRSARRSSRGGQGHRRRW